MGMSLLFLISNSGQIINHQIKVPRSCCSLFLSQGKNNNQFLNWIFKKMTSMARDLDGGKQMQVYLQGREALEATESQCLASQRSQQQFRMAGASLPRGRGEITGKEGQDPDTHTALPGTEQGTCLRPNCCPLGAYSYNNTRWKSTTMYRM